MIGYADLGLHRIGLFATQCPRIAWPILCLALFLAVFGVSQLKTDASLTKAFHSGTPEYHTYQKLTSTFPGSEHDLFVLVQGPNLFKPDVLAALQELHFELPLIDHVQSAASIFALRKSVATSPDPDPLIPEEIPQTQAELKALERAILTHPMARQRLLSPRSGDGQLTIFAVSVDPKKDDAKLRNRLIGEVREISKQLLEPLQLEFTIGGVPIARQELLQATKTDAKVFSALGFLVGLIIGAFVFRRWQFVIVASVCPLIAIVAGIGTIGLFGGLYSPFMNGIPPLIMAIAFTDCMHLLFAIRGNAQAGMPVEQAVQRACEDVGPACGIASLTTAAALLSLALAPSPLVQQFGLWAAAAAVVAVCVVFLALPLLSLLAFRGMASSNSPHHLDSFALLARGCRRLGGLVRAQALNIFVLSLVLTVVLAATYYALEPRYRLSDQVPINGSFRVVNTALDRFIGGSGPVYIVVKWDPKSAPSDRKLFRAVSAAHAVLQSAAPERNVLSLKSLGAGFPDVPDASEARSVEAMTLFTSDQQSRLLQRARGGALVSVLMPDINADEMAPFAASVDQALGAVRQQHPEFSFVVTSLPVLLAEGAPSLISQINRSLIVAFVVVIAMLALMFRSWQAGVISLMPNVLPVFTAGCVIYLIAGGLEYASIIALTVGFGLAVDDTAHFFNRLKLEHTRAGPTSDPVRATLEHVGPILIVTSIVLVCGLAVTAFGELRTAYLFGTTCIAILIGALIADLLILPALLFVMSRYKALRLWR